MNRPTEAPYRRLESRARTAPGTRPRRASARLVLGIGLMLGAPGAGQPPSMDDLRNLSIEDLGRIEITSVARRAQSLSDAPAAVFVITREDIRRSGATSLPEALRLAPNLQVARVDSDRWAITARGFNATSANKLQVLIDGRTVYTPLFSGVFWDVQDTFLPDIERIEVISGPAGTLWGSNAVNGVINIITRDTAETEGGMVRFGIGSHERDAGLRYGGRAGSAATWRAWASGFDRDASETAAGASLENDWRVARSGFRVDRDGVADRLTLLGGGYSGEIDRSAPVDGRISGIDLLGRWSRDLEDGAAVTVQAYVDRTRRKTATFGETLDTFDVEAQHRLRVGKRHDVVWGGGFRHHDDEVENSAALAFLPARRSLHIANLYVQDTVALSDAVSVVLGLKLEDNTYTGLEVQPALRLAWKLSERSTLWSAVSRAVRTPSRLDREIFVPGVAPFTVAGGPDFESEVLVAWEAGWRTAPSEASSLSVSGFYHDYDELRSIEPAPGGGLPLTLANGLVGESWGLEAWGSWRVRSWWTLHAGASWLEKRLELAPGSRDRSSVASSETDPENQFSLRSLMDLPRETELDVWLRSVDGLPADDVPSYVTLDVRFGWRPAPGVDLSLIGSDLLEDSHPEFGSAPGRAEVERAFLLRAQWSFR